MTAMPSGRRYDCSPVVRIDGPWITGEGRRHGQAAGNETEFYRAELSVCGSAVTG
jgi:hypothetical protein